MGTAHVKWPHVIGEFDTVQKLIDGYSIARFGDGEFGILRGRGYTRMREPNKRLTKELQRVIKEPREGCLVGIPTMDPKGTKYANWKRHAEGYIGWLNPDLQYYSSLMSRPDCGEWMETKEYADHVRKIWQGKRVLVVSEPYSKLLKDVLRTCEVEHVECPMHNAYDHIDEYEKAILKAKPDLALLSVGVTATALANRIAKFDIQAVDIGSIGGFLCRWI